MNTWQDTTLNPQERAEALLADLSLEEKVAQLGSYWERPKPPELEAGGEVAPMESEFERLRPGFDQAAAHGLGHLTRVFGAEPKEVASAVTELAGRQRAVMDASGHGIPAIAHEECLTGFTALGATVYPAAIAWGATWDPALVEEMAAAIGEDMHAVGVHQGLSPLLDVVRDYRWGRVEETCGEDPYLVGTLGSAYVRGLQSSGTVATLKHFVGYPASRAARNHAPVAMGPRELEDIMLPSFEMAVREGGAGSVMNSYSDIDGEPAAASRHLLTEVLRERWGFTGTVVSDYWAVSFLETMHRVAATRQDAGVLALSAGIDVELPDVGAYTELVDAVRQGRLDESLVDRAALRVLTQKIGLGLLDPGWAPDTAGADTDLDSPRNRDIARRMAEESIILLANDGTLPLPPAASVALVGPCAQEARTFMGCYSFPNHVLSRYEDQGTGIPIRSLAQALGDEMGQARVVVEQGVPILAEDRSGIEAAVAAARDAEVAVVAVGDLAGLFGGGTSGEGCDVVDLTLPGVQAELVEAVLATGTPTVLVVVSGRPYSLGAFAHRCAAVVQAFMPGCEGGPALAGVLSGRLNPTGRLPIGIPNHPGGQPGTYIAPPLGQWADGVSNLDPRPLYPFGAGTGYTTYEVGDLSLSAAEIPTDGTLDVSATVTNTGDRDGAEVVQLYLNDLVAQVTRPTRQLVGFARVPLAAGASRRVTFSVHADRTSFTGLDLRRIVEPGEIEVLVGTSSEDLPLRARFTITGTTRTVPEGRVLTTPVTID